MKGREFGCDQVIIGIGSYVSESVGSSYRELSCVVQSWIKERSFPVHFKIGNKSVPVRDGTPCACPGVLVMTCQSESVRDQCGTGYIRSCYNAISNLLGIK